MHLRWELQFTEMGKKKSIEYLFNSRTLCRRQGGSRYKLQVPGGPEGGLGPHYVAHAFVILGSISICPFTNRHFQPKHKSTLQLRVSVSDLL